MSGHSKWAKIKRSKGVNDQKRGALFTKLGNAITTASREGGADPDLNFELRLAIDKAKSANLPKDNVLKAIEKGVGTGKDAVTFENVSYEGFISGDIAFIVDCLTDNTNRTYAEIKKGIEQTGGVIGAKNSVSWQFDEKGSITMYCAKIEKSTKYGAPDKLIKFDNRDEIMLQLLDIKGVEDVQETQLEFESNDELVGENSYLGLIVYTDKNEFNSVYKAIVSLGYKIESAEVVKVCKNPISVDEEKEKKLENFIEKMDEFDDVQNVWHNVK